MIDRYIAALADVREQLEAEELKAEFDFANEIRGSIREGFKGVYPRAVRDLGASRGPAGRHRRNRAGAGSAKG